MISDRMPIIDLHIESREQLISALGEAAEIEHSLMCCYLYAMFSLKKSETEGVNAQELAVISGWRRSIRSIALEEMTHLTLVANLTSAIGGTPHFLRPNLPASPGFYPAGVVIKLAPFCLDTVDHFIFLERPAEIVISDGKTFEPVNYRRTVPSGRLMPFASDYATIGDLYKAIRRAIDNLAKKLGEAALFCGEASRQIHPSDSALPGLAAITDLASAHRALDTIVIQGEGSVAMGDSHFSRFQSIKTEYQQLLALRPEFSPARPVARNPLMRTPVNNDDRVHIIAEPAASLIDLANALYVHMLRMLQQVYSSHVRKASDKQALLKSAYLLMHATTSVAEHLTFLPANPEHPGTTAGMSFATIRMLAPLEVGETEVQLLRERTEELLEHIKKIATTVPELLATISVVSDVHVLLAAMSFSTVSGPATEPSQAGPSHAEQNQTEPQPGTTAEVEIAIGKSVEIHFEGKRCMHSRNCVLSLPQVFLANTTGQWLQPDATSVERLVAVAENCPSGAIRYVRRDNGAQEAPPPVNILNVRENGPLAVRAQILLRGVEIGYRATFCRCGRSNNKPFCDGSHAGNFVATGEPVTGDTTALDVRDGPISIAPQQNGPLEISGNLEICAGTGRTVARVTQARLCRCGHSNNKPFCDGSHAAVNFIAN